MYPFLKAEDDEEYNEESLLRDVDHPPPLSMLSSTNRDVLTVKSNKVLEDLQKFNRGLFEVNALVDEIVNIYGGPVHSSGLTTTTRRSSVTANKQ